MTCRRCGSKQTKTFPIIEMQGLTHNQSFSVLSGIATKGLKGLGVGARQGNKTSEFYRRVMAIKPRPPKQSRTFWNVLKALTIGIFGNSIFMGIFMAIGLSTALLPFAMMTGFGLSMWFGFRITKPFSGIENKMNGFDFQSKMETWNNMALCFKCGEVFSVSPLHQDNY